MCFGPFPIRGLFEAGAVLVGTHAFLALGNALGVRWGAGAGRTQDLDLASKLLLEAPERAVTLSGEAVLVNVPAPARFAFHKLVVAEMRGATLQAKAVKDRAQARAIFEVLLESRPGDIPLAWHAALGHGSRLKTAFEKAVTGLKRRAPELGDRLGPLLVRKRSR